MTLMTLRENLSLLKELQEASSSVRYGLDEVPDATMIMAHMFDNQIKTFVDEITRDVLDEFKRGNKD